MVGFSVVPGPLGSRHHTPSHDWLRPLYGKELNADRAGKDIHHSMDIRFYALHTSQPMQLTLSME